MRILNELEVKREFQTLGLFCLQKSTNFAETYKLASLPEVLCPSSGGTCFFVVACFDKQCCVDAFAACGQIRRRSGLSGNAGPMLGTSGKQ